MNITRKNFLRLTSAATVSAAIEAAVTACGGGGGGGGSSASSSTNTNTSTTSNPSSGTGDGTTITPPTTPPATPSATGNWSDPLTWAGPGIPANYVPGPNDNIYITSSQVVYLDTDAVCAVLTIYGTLRSPVTPTRNISITTGNINVMGSGVLQIGSEASPFPAAYTATITLTGAEVGRVTRTVLGTQLGFSNSGEGRSIRVEAGGTLSLIGTAPTVTRTKLNAHAAAGASSFSVIDNTGWKAGDEIAIGTTDFFGISVPQKMTLASVNTSAKTVTTTSSIASSRWGLMQYVTDTGMSLTPGTLTGAPTGIGTASATPSTLDERAFVVHLTRNIVVQGGADSSDSAWAARQFGAHCMFMGRTSSIKLNGVQFRRMGQAGALGRYPIHWHMMSYNMPNGMNAVSDGQFIGAVIGNHYAKNCAISESSQRMIVIHGTNGVTLDSNVGFDITGHGIFLEDGSEQDNVITNNVVMKIRAPSSTNKLLNHDVAAGVPSAYSLGSGSTIGTAGIWNTNPKNTFTGNWINDSAGAGMWNSFTNQCFGLSFNVPMVPYNVPVTLLDNNWAMGNAGCGVLTNDQVLNDKGDLYQSGYVASFLSNPVMRVTSMKNLGGGYNNRISEGTYQNFTCADNAGMDVFGQATSEVSVMTNTLSIAESLNNTNSRRLSSYRAAFATYHELLNFKNCTLVGFTYIAGAQGDGTQTFTGGGIYRLWDLYIQPFFSFSENTGNKQINCDAPFRTLPPFKDGAPDNNRHWSLAGAIYDKTGIFGHQGKYWIYNDPFLTYSATSPVNITTGIPSNGVITDDHYFGITGFKTQDLLDLYTFTLPISISRQDTSGNEVGNWNIPDGATSTMLGWMRSFAAHQGGRYLISIPGHTPGNYFEFIVYYQKSSGDKCLVAVPFSGSLTPRVYQAALGVARQSDNRADLSTVYTGPAVASGYSRFLTATSNFANVVADTTGTIFWQDRTNNLVWMQVATYQVGNTATTGGIYGTNKFTIEYRNIIVVVTV